MKKTYSTRPSQGAPLRRLDGGWRRHAASELASDVREREACCDCGYLACGCGQLRIEAAAAEREKEPEQQRHDANDVPGPMVVGAIVTYVDAEHVVLGRRRLGRVTAIDAFGEWCDVRWQTIGDRTATATTERVSNLWSWSSHVSVAAGASLKTAHAMAPGQAVRRRTTGVTGTITDFGARGLDVLWAPIRRSNGKVMATRRAPGTSLVPIDDNN